MFISAFPLMQLTLDQPDSPVFASGHLNALTAVIHHTLKAQNYKETCICLSES